MTDDAQKIADTRILFQGDHKTPRDEVQPGFFSVMAPSAAAIGKSANPLTTGRRLTLADWIASRDNPLTARVFVNRIWQQLMGRPLVATPNDFGLAGSPARRPRMALCSTGWPMSLSGRAGRQRNLCA